MDKPLVSVVMPVYKVEPYIARSVQSVIDQTYDNLELILVDDGTPDRSIEIAQTLLNGSNIKYEIIRQENVGLGWARNAGLRACKGEWIFFLDSDDIICDNTIEILVEECKEDIDFVFAGFHEIYSYDEAIKTCAAAKAETYDRDTLQEKFLLRNIIILAPGTLYNRKFLMEHNLLFEKIPWSEDQQFIWRVLHETNKASYVNTKTYQYLMRRNSIMSATQLDKMVLSYRQFSQLSELYSNEKRIGNYIVPRWVMGTLNSASIILAFSDWKDLWNKIDGRKNFITLLSFPAWNVRIGALMCLVSQSVYYHFSRTRKSKRIIGGN